MNNNHKLSFLDDDDHLLADDDPFVMSSSDDDIAVPTRKRIRQRQKTMFDSTPYIEEVEVEDEGDDNEDLEEEEEVKQEPSSSNYSIPTSTTNKELSSSSSSSSKKKIDSEESKWFGETLLGSNVDFDYFPDDNVQLDSSNGEMQADEGEASSSSSGDLPESFTTVQDDDEIIDAGSSSANNDNDDLSIKDDLDDVVNYYYNPVQDRMIERRLTEKQKAKIRKQRAAMEAHNRRKLEQKLARQRVIEERERRRAERDAIKMQSRRAIEARKAARRELNRQRMVEAAQKRAQAWRLQNNARGVIIDNQQYQSMVGAYVREQHVLEEMKVEGLQSSKQYLSMRELNAAISMAEYKKHLPVEVQHQQQQQRNVNGREATDELERRRRVRDAISLGQNEQLRRRLISSLAFSQEKFHACSMDELQMLTADDIRRILRIRGSSEQELERVKKRVTLIDKLRKSYSKVSLL